MKFENEVPGPGTYNINSIDRIQAYKIMKKQNFTKVPNLDKNSGCGEYNKLIYYSKKGFKFGTSTRPGINSSCEFTPGPAAYDYIADLDFKTNPDAKGRIPKFHFG